MTDIFNLIKQKVSILDTISQYTTLKKTGLYYKGICPLHNERTPSFTVSPARDIYYCFGCHAGGDVISFIAKLENCSQIEAAKLLAEQHQIVLPDQGITDTIIEHKKLYINIFKVVALWAQVNLQRNKAVFEYLVSRGLNSKSILDFELGYFPRGVEAIKSLLLFCKDKNIMASDLIEAKLIIKTKNVYSPFEERILFPIKDHMGRICGFGGRIIPNSSKKDNTKYFNSHDHAYFSKGSILFGLDKAKKSIQDKDAVFLTEGYMDTIALVQHGYINTIATLGTACTENHIKQLSKYTSRIFIVYDSDAAGQNGIMRMSELCWQYNIDLFVINLPKGEDPASFLEKKGDFNGLLSKSVTIFDFFINSFGSDFDKRGLQERVTLIKKVVDIICKLKDPLKEDILLSKVADTFKIDLQTIKAIKLEIIGGSKNNLDIKFIKRNQSPDILQDQNKISLLEKKMFSGILYNSELFLDIDQELVVMWFSEPIRLLLSKIKKIKKDIGVTDINSILQKLNESDRNIISKIILESQENSLEENYDQLKLQFYKKQWKLFIYNTKLKIESLQQVHDILSIQKLLNQIETIKQKVLQ